MEDRILKRKQFIKILTESIKFLVRDFDRLHIDWDDTDTEFMSEHNEVVIYFKNGNKKVFNTKCNSFHATLIQLLKEV